ncbi:methylase, partial [mine drainage metagenome]
MKAADYGKTTNSVAAFVSTNSICQGQQIPTLWSEIFATEQEIAFAHTSFKWKNLASHNAGVTVVVVGMSNHPPKVRRLFSEADAGGTFVKEVEYINAYLIPAANVIVKKRLQQLCGLTQMNYGNYPGDGNHLTISRAERDMLLGKRPDLQKLVRQVVGAQEFIKGLSRYCLWIDNEDLELALSEPVVAQRIEAVRRVRMSSRDSSLNKLAMRSHQYRDRNVAK